MKGEQDVNVVLNIAKMLAKSDVFWWINDMGISYVRDNQ